MSAKKTRPKHGDPITDGMSLRDQAAALGISTAELCEWQRLAEVPEDDFEARLKAQNAGGNRVTAKSIIRGTTPVPARGRVDRAIALYRSMTVEEREQFLEAIRKATA